jgi:SpoVK/Ycf46/Vps4 family AAA+-type ATPase
VLFFQKDGCFSCLSNERSQEWIGETMARSDLLLELVKAGVVGDSRSFRITAEAIAADERAKKHSGVSDRILRALESNVAAKNIPPTIRTKDGSGGITQIEPRRSMSELYFERPIMDAIDELVEEQRRADVLRAHGLEPRHRVLLAGPPGNGKTSLAEALAYELVLPLFTVRYDAVITSYLGETAQRLRRLFDFVRTQPCVLFFDEFDAIGKERGDLHETGEIKRVVTTLLLQLDDLPSYCVLVGATNHPELLDRATWRRFEMRLEIPTPSDSCFIDYFADQLKTIADQQPGYSAKRLYESVRPRNFSEAEDFFKDIKRRLALSLGSRELRYLIDERVKMFIARRLSDEDGDSLANKPNPAIS